MTVSFYMNSKPSNYVTKTPTFIMTATGTMRDSSNITSPVIRIGTTNNIIGINYAHIPDYDRYYFVDNIVNIRNNLWDFHLRCDVLTSFWDDIKTCDCIVSRNEYKRTTDLIDDQIYATADSLYEIIKFPINPFTVQGATDKRFVLIVQGAGEASSSD